MKPVSSKFFGADIGKVRVKFYDGSAVHNGYIVKQVGPIHYIVTADGTTMVKVKLTSDLTKAQMLDGQATLVPASVTGRATMVITDGVTKYVSKLTDKHAHLVGGGHLIWTLATATSTHKLLGTVVAKPVNTAAPTITGTAKVGQTLTASTGTWTNAPTSYLYQWKAAGTAITNATASTYVPVTGDIGKTITVSVTAVKNGADAIATASAATVAVVA